MEGWKQLTFFTIVKTYSVTLPSGPFLTPVHYVHQSFHSLLEMAQFLSFLAEFFAERWSSSVYLRLI